MPATLTALSLLAALSATELPTVPLESATPPPIAPPIERPEASPDRIRLTREQRMGPRSGSYVAQLDRLNPLMRRFNAQAGSGIVIRYARGDEGSVWATELRAWLVALGIPSARIALVSVAQAEDALIIEIQTNGVPPH